MSNIRWLVLVCLMLALGSLQEPSTSPAGTPQNETAPSAGQKSDSGAKTSEVDQLLLALYDINWFNNIRPLNLTREQIDRLLKTHENAYKQLEEQIQQEAKELRNRKDEILRVREDTSRGKSVPKEFLETMRRLEQDALQKRRSLRTQLINSVSSELKPYFTPEQMEYMVKRSKEVLDSAGIDTSQLKEEQLFALFVENVFLAERAPILLKEWRTKNLP